MGDWRGFLPSLTWILPSTLKLDLGVCEDTRAAIRGNTQVGFGSGETLRVQRHRSSEGILWGTGYGWLLGEG